MEQNSGWSGSVGDAMSIFGRSIDVRRRPGKSGRRAVPVQKDLQPGIQLPARSSAERPRRRRAAAERERVRAESELTRAAAMAVELERQIEQTNAKVRSHRSELQGIGAKSVRTRRGGGGVEEPGDQPPASGTVYGEVMQELDRVKRELRKLQLEVKAAREAKATAERDAEAASTASRVISGGSHVPGGVEREAGEGNEERSLEELADEAAEETSKKTDGLQGEVDASRATASDLDDRLATASSDAGLRRAEMALVRGTERSHTERSSSSSVASAKTARTHGEHDDDSSLSHAAEAELNSARVELDSNREEGHRLMASMERTRKETARVVDEITRLTEQEEKAGAQVQQLNAKLLKARSRLEAAAAADDRADEILSNLEAMLRRLDEDAEAAEKEKALTELESRGVRADAESAAAEIVAAEQRIRASVRELEEVRAAEEAAARKLRDVVESVMLPMAAAVVSSTSSQRSGNVTISRFEYEYLTGRAEVVRAVADKKVAAAEAWVEARRAGEKEMIMRAEAIERDIAGEAVAAAEMANEHEQRPREGSQRAPAPASGSKKTTRARSTPSSSVARNPRAPSFSVRRKKKQNYLS